MKKSHWLGVFESTEFACFFLFLCQVGSFLTMAHTNLMVRISYGEKCKKFPTIKHQEKISFGGHLD